MYLFSMTADKWLLTSIFSHAHGEFKFLQPRQQCCSATAAYGPSVLWPRRSSKLCISVQCLYRQKESPACGHQLLWSTRSAQRLHQRRTEYVVISEPAFWLQARRHGHSHRRSTQPDESADQAKYPPRHALARQGRQAQ